MKLNPKASLSFKKLRADAKPAFGTNVVNALDSSTFAGLPVPSAELQTLCGNLAAAVTDSLTGSHTAVASVKNAVAAWNNAFTLTANYITTLAAGDEMKIREAGFVPTKSERIPAQKPGAATTFKATINGSKGAIIAGVKSAVAGATSYMFYALPDGAIVSHVGDTMVITIGGKSVYLTASTSKQTELYDLPSGVPYNVTMYAINTAGSGPAAAPQQVIPQ